LDLQDVERIDKQIFELEKSVRAAAGMSENEMEMAESLKLLERDLEMVKRKLSGGFAAALGADPQALTGAARQVDLLEVCTLPELPADVQCEMYSVQQCNGARDLLKIVIKFLI
jgi:hypothetical protein